MKPLKLTMQAFGPYANQEVIDFREVTKAGLFGIYGPTGSGKTTIFSAISFALYGEPARKDQQISSLRSDHAPADLKTMVEFCFALGSKSYLIRREPDQEKPKQSGEGTSSSRHQAWLFDVTGLNVDELSENNFGKIIAEKKVNSVRDEVLGLVGYGADQFKQIVLLPQGKFETFLTANTDNRMTILRELFDVSVFRTFTTKLKEDAQQAEARVREQLRLSDQQLHDQGYESLDALEQGINDATIQYNLAEVHMQDCKKAHYKAEKQLQAAQAIENQFLELQQVTTRMIELETKGASLVQKRQLVLGLRLAKEVGPYYKGHRTAQVDLEKADSNFDLAEDHFKKCSETLFVARDQQNEAEENAKELPSLQSQLSEYKTYLRTIKGSAEVVAQLSIAHKALDDAQTSLAACENKLFSTERELKESEKKLQNLKEIEDIRGTLNSDLLALEQQRDQCKSFNKVKEELAIAKIAKEASEEKCAKLALLVDQKKSTFDTAEQALSKMQAVHLAAKLSPDMACPVCGSEDHPNLATGSAESQGLDENFRISKDQLILVQQQHANAKEERASTIALITERKRSLGEFEVPENDLDNIALLVSEKLNKISMLGDIGVLETAVEGLENLRKIVAASIEEKDNAQRNTAAKKNAVTNLEGKLDGMLQAMPEALQDEAALQLAIDNLDDLVTSVSGNLKTAKETKEAAELKTASAHAVLNQKREALTIEAAREADAQKTLVLELKSRNFCQEQFLRFLKKIDDLPSVELELKEFDDECLTTNNRKGLLEKSIEGAHRPHIALLDKEATQSAELRDVAVKNVTTAHTDMEQLGELKKKTLRRRQNVEKEESQTATLREMAALCSANNTIRLDLETFAIGAIFDQVLIAANLRLMPMSSGRYSLDRSIEGGKGTAKRGLGIMVNDVHTGRSRDTSTLSGGETFIAALALALGLSDVVERLSGGIKLDTIFIDEGFGTLDADQDAGSLDKVLETLKKTVGETRSVGLISHVSLVQKTIPTGFRIEKYPDGSRVKYNHNA